MNVRHFLLCAIVVVSIKSNLIAQTTSPYLFFKPIYAFQANPQKLNETVAVSTNGTYRKGVYGSYGRGFSFEAGLGKMINSTFGFELGFEYLAGKRIKSTVNSSADNVVGSVDDKINGFLIKPVIVIRNSGDLMTIYSKVGIAINVSATHYTNEELSLTNTGNNLLITTSSKENSKAKIGFTAAFGLGFRVTESISFFTELNGQMISLPMSRGRYTKYLQNGADRLKDFTTSQREWRYVKEGFLDAGQNNDDQPQNRLSNPLNFSYIGLSVGINYHF